MQPFAAKWNKIGTEGKPPVEVTVLGFSTASISDSGGHRPVAIIQDDSDGGKMRFVELKYLEGQYERTAANPQSNAAAQA